MKDKKTILGILIIIGLLLSIGLTYAWFNAKIENLNSSVSVVTTGKLELTYIDGEEIVFNNMIPGNSISKTFSVKNTGDETVTYDLGLENTENTVQNDELVIEAKCTRLNSDGVEEGTCKNVSGTSVAKESLSRNITIEPGVTYKYNFVLTL